MRISAARSERPRRAAGFIAQVETLMTDSESPEPLKFEQAMQRLDGIVDAMERGDIGIEESIQKFDEAMKLAAHCRKVLDDAEQRIRVIQLDAAGKPVATPLEGSAGDDPPSAADQ